MPDARRAGEQPIRAGIRLSMDAPTDDHAVVERCCRKGAAGLSHTYYDTLMGERTFSPVGFPFDELCTIGT